MAQVLQTQFVWLCCDWVSQAQFECGCAVTWVSQSQFECGCAMGFPDAFFKFGCAVTWVSQTHLFKFGCAAA